MRDIIELNKDYDKGIVVLTQLNALYECSTEGLISDNLKSLLSPTIGEFNYSTESIMDKIKATVTYLIDLIKTMIRRIKDWIHKHFSQDTKIVKNLDIKVKELEKSIVLDIATTAPMYAYDKLDTAVNVLTSLSILDNMVSEANWVNLSKGRMNLGSLNIKLTLGKDSGLDVTRALQALSPKGVTFNSIGYTDEATTLTLIKDFVDFYHEYLNSYISTKLQGTIDRYNRQLNAVTVNTNYSPLVKEGLDAAKANVASIILQIKLISTLLDLGTRTVMTFR